MVDHRNWGAWEKVLSDVWLTTRFSFQIALYLLVKFGKLSQIKVPKNITKVQKPMPLVPESNSNAPVTPWNQ